jgi:predicted TIM-barrel fold metal-dependent hydrolase
MTLIALEEHFAWDPASADNVVAMWLRANNTVAYDRLYDRGRLRIEQMDAAGIDFQILSLFDPGVQDETDVAHAVDLARRANDDLAESVRANPNRFGGFATLATQDPDAASVEFERAVIELGLVGALINGHCQGRYLDDPAYEGLFARAEALGAPVYLHPTTPHRAVMDAWFAPYVDDGLHLASWGFAAETGTHVLRLIYSGLFDKFPQLQMIIGHPVRCCRSLPTASTAITGSAATVPDTDYSTCPRSICATTFTSRQAETSAHRPSHARSR